MSDGPNNGDYIYADFEGFVYISSNPALFSSGMSEETARERMRTMYSDTPMKVEEIEDLTIEGYIAEKLQVQQSFGSDDYAGGVVVFKVGDNLISVIAESKVGTSASNQLTMKAVLDSVKPTGRQFQITLKTEDGKTIDSLEVYDLGKNTIVELPSRPDGLADNEVVTQWSSPDSNVKIEQSDDGAYRASGVTDDIVLTCSTEKRFTVTFTDGNGNVLSRILVRPGGSAMAPTEPTRSGYNFTGWDASLENVTSDITINATWKEKPKVYSAGIYRVGTDIPAGEYAIDSNGSYSAYYCVYPDTAKTEILGNDNFFGRAYVTVSDGMLLEVNRASFYLAEGAQPKGDYATSSGTYKIGFDMPAGTYRLKDTSTMGGYYCIYNNSNPDAQIVQNNNFEGQDYVTVSDGQYLVLSRCVAEPA